MFRRSQPSAERPSFPCPPSGFQGVVPGPSGPRPAPAAPLSPGALSWAGLGVRLSPFGLCKGVSSPRVRGHAYSLRAAKADPRPGSDVSTNPAGCGRVQALLCGCRCGRLRGPFRTPCPFSRAPPASSPFRTPCPSHGLPLRPPGGRTSDPRWAGPVWVAWRAGPAHFEVTFAQERLDLRSRQRARGVAGRKGWAGPRGNL